MRGQCHAPAALYPRERPGTHCTGGWVGPRAGLDGRKISPPSGFDPRTVQPVASRYTEYATLPTKYQNYIEIRISKLHRKRECYHNMMSMFVNVRTMYVQSLCPCVSVRNCSVTCKWTWYNVFHVSVHTCFSHLLKSVASMNVTTYLFRVLKSVISCSTCVCVRLGMFVLSRN